MENDLERRLQRERIDAIEEELRLIDRKHKAQSAALSLILEVRRRPLLKERRTLVNAEQSDITTGYTRKIWVRFARKVKALARV